MQALYLRGSGRWRREKWLAEDFPQREGSEIEILSRAIKQTVIQELAEIGYNGTGSLVARERFELSSEAPEAPILDR
jgi:hypothetical protein